VTEKISFFWVERALALRLLDSVRTLVLKFNELMVDPLKTLKRKDYDIG
jgi:hypothetical protein